MLVFRRTGTRCGYPEIFHMLRGKNAEANDAACGGDAEDIVL